REPEEDVPALRRRHEAPLVERRLRVRDRLVDVVCGRAPHPSQDFARRGRDRLERLCRHRAESYSGASVSGNVPVTRARRRSRVTLRSLNSAPVYFSRRSGPWSLRSTITVTFGFSP